MLQEALSAAKYSLSLFAKVNLALHRRDLG
jgi:hypothetical protein